MSLLYRFISVPISPFGLAGNNDNIVTAVLAGNLVSGGQVRSSWGPFGKDGDLLPLSVGGHEQQKRQRRFCYSIQLHLIHLLLA
jgi:hypothetical protein